MTLQYSVYDVIFAYNISNCWVQKVLPIRIWSYEVGWYHYGDFPLLEKLKNIVKKIQIVDLPACQFFF